jgi:hypothetical protein
MTAHLLKRGPLNTSYTHIHDAHLLKEVKSIPLTHIYMTAHLLKETKIDTTYTHIHDRSFLKRDKIDTTYIHIHDRSFLKRDKIDTLTHIYMAASDSVVCFVFHFIA